MRNPVLISLLLAVCLTGCLLPVEERAPAVGTTVNSAGIKMGTCLDPGADAARKLTREELSQLLPGVYRHIGGISIGNQEASGLELDADGNWWALGDGLDRLSAANSVGHYEFDGQVPPNSDGRWQINFVFAGGDLPTLMAVQCSPKQLQMIFPGPVGESVYEAVE